MTSLNCQEEVNSARELLKIDKWAGKVNYIQRRSKYYRIEIS